MIEFQMVVKAKKYWAVGMNEYIGGGQINNTIVEYGGKPTGRTREEFFDQTGVEFVATKDTDLDGMVSEFVENALYVQDTKGEILERKD